MRILPAAAATVALTFAVATPASGHAELVPWQLPPGATGGLLLLVTHGCGDEDEWISTEPLPEEPTVAVTIPVPLELTIEPGEYEGWSLSTETDDGGRTTSITWTSDDPAGTYETLQFPIDVTVPDLPDGSEVWLPVIQECTEGESLAWTLEGDVRGGDEVPAMKLFLNEDSTVPATWSEGSTPTVDGDVATADAAGGTSRAGGLGLPSLLLAVLGVGGAAVALRRRAHVRRPPAA